MQIEIKHLSKSFDDVTPLKDISLKINQGEIVSFIGSSGTGKSTLVKCLNKLILPTSGDILFDGQSILSKETSLVELRKRVGIVFQSYNLFSRLTVIENLMIPQIDILKKTKQEAYDNAMALLKQVGLSEKYLSYPDELSGGQQQRIAIARALAIDPEVIILDEPTSALDPTTVGEVEAVISKLAKSEKTIIMITHDLSLARRMSTRIVFLADGYIAEEGTPEEIFEHPKNEVTKRFVRNLKYLDLNISSKNYDFIELMNKVRNFCYQNNLSKKRINYCNLIFEEIIHNHLIEKLNSHFNISFTIEYDERKDDVAIEIKYSGKKFNPFDSVDISISLVKEFTLFDYSYNKKYLINILSITFKDN